MLNEISVSSYLDYLSRHVLVIM